MPGSDSRPVSDDTAQSDAQQALEALRESEERYRTIVETSHEGVWLLDARAVTTYANRRMHEMLGVGPDDMVGRHLFDFLDADGRDQASLKLERRARGIAEDHEFRFVRPDGSMLWTLISTTPIHDSTGQYAGALGMVMDITERKRAEDELRYQAAVLEAQGNSTIDGILVVDRQGKKIFQNHRTAELWKIPPHIAEDRDDAAQVRHVTHSTKNPERFRERVAYLYSHPDETTRGEVELVDGTVLDVYSAPVQGKHGQNYGRVWTFRDITERKCSEQALRASELRLRYALEASAEGVWDWNVRTGLVHFSPHWAESLGYTVQEIPPTVDFWRSIVHPEDLPQVTEAVRAHFDGRSPTYECENRLRKKSGDYRENLRRGKVVEWDAEGRPLRMVGTDTDITERKRAEAERRRTEIQLQQTQRLESLGVLAGGIAHDFNNLLQAIIGYTDLARLELPAASPARESLHHALDTARRATELTSRMLAYSGRATFVVEPLDLSALVKDLSRLLQVSISKKCILKFDLKENLPVVQADASQVRQVVMNLVINASEAMGDLGGEIAVTSGVSPCDRAFLAEAGQGQGLAQGSYVWVEVTDTGIGMSAETRARVFDPFFTTKFIGRGLGLAAARGIMRGHQGTITCDSEPGRGTTFKALFPAAAVPAPMSEQRSSGEAVWRGSGTVLVVDDEDSVRDAASRMLKRMGFTVLLASDGREGVDVFRSEGQRINLVLLDVTMPHLDGEGALLEMRRLRGDVKVILSSGYTEDTAAKNVQGERPTAFIKKPYSVQELMAVVRTALESEAGAGEARRDPPSTRD